ncbi:MAG TPA: TIGR03086 family metal-binding protein [Ilumatobacteraceae bacterium]|nr:TIGR03086 family metal-binding protein [Ilumatobacteraceae bacterium]
MTEQAAVWRLTADKWTEVADAITDDDWSKPTTCEEFSVRELVDHAMHWQAMGGGILGAGTAPGDPWSDVRPALSAALDDPSNLEGVAEAFGGMPKQQVLGLLITDLLVHSWDLARSLGVDETLPLAAVEAALIGLQRMPEEMLRSGTMFAPAVEVADDASAQDRLIAFTGRQP